MVYYRINRPTRFFYVAHSLTKKDSCANKEVEQYNLSGWVRIRSLTFFQG